jgi:uncharacterized membrane protein YczE
MAQTARPTPDVRPLAHRLALLYAGLVLGGTGFALFVAADLGLGSWDVFHQGVSKVAGISMGRVVILTGVGVLLLWIPLRQRPGLGTISNVLVVGIVIDAALAVLPAPDHPGARASMLAVALVMTGAGAAMYLAADFGPGPRDGVMTGLAVRGRSIGTAGVTVDLSVLGLGFLLGGTVGIGTVLAALTYGPVVDFFLPRFGGSTRASIAP